MNRCVRRGGSVVSASDLGSESREFESWLIYVVFIGKTLTSHKEMGTSKLGGYNVGRTLRWKSGNTPTNPR